MSISDSNEVAWISSSVKSPHLPSPTRVVAGMNVPYTKNNNGRQTVNIYLPEEPATLDLVGKSVKELPPSSSQRKLPRIQVHIHGGAWRDPNLRAPSIEAAVAHAFADKESAINAIVGIDYSLSPFPANPAPPHDGSRQAQFPDHVKDIFAALNLLRTLGLSDGSYILTGHSAGACLAFQALLPIPSHHRFENMPSPPVPAAILGMNGLYDLPKLVTDLPASHVHLAADYESLISNAYGTDRTVWESASPERLDPTEMEQRVRDGRGTPLIVLEQSSEDQLVPLNQMTGLLRRLELVKNLQVIRGYRCTGRHAAPWEEGDMLWQSVQDVFSYLVKS